MKPIRTLLRYLIPRFNTVKAVPIKTHAGKTVWMRVDSAESIHPDHRYKIVTVKTFTFLGRYFTSKPSS